MSHQVFATPYAAGLLVTYHPSALLRMPRGPAYDAAKAELTSHQRLAAELARGRGAHAAPSE